MIRSRARPSAFRDRGRSDPDPFPQAAALLLLERCGVPLHNPAAIEAARMNEAFEIPLGAGDFAEAGGGVRSHFADPRVGGMPNLTH